MTLYFSDGLDNLCESTSADSKNPECAVWSSRQCLHALGSLLRCIPQLWNAPLFMMKGFCGGHLHFKKKTFSISPNTFHNNHMWCLFFIWWHLPTLKWTGAPLCTLTMDITWLLILIIHCLSLMTISLHIRQIGLDLMVFYLTFIKYGMRLYG